jgi:hypothetical protein
MHWLTEDIERIDFIGGYRGSADLVHRCAGCAFLVRNTRACFGLHADFRVFLRRSRITDRSSGPERRAATPVATAATAATVAAATSASPAAAEPREWATTSARCLHPGDKRHEAVDDLRPVSLWRRAFGLPVA